MPWIPLLAFIGAIFAVAALIAGVPRYLRWRDQIASLNKKIKQVEKGLGNAELKFNTFFRDNIVLRGTAGANNWNVGHAIDMTQLSERWRAAQSSATRIIWLIGQSELDDAIKKMDEGIQLLDGLGYLLEEPLPAAEERPDEEF